MFGNTPPANRGQSTVEGSLHGVATMVALSAALLCSGQIYDITSDPVYAYLLKSYGDPSLAEMGMLAWTGLATAAVFFFCRAMFVLALILIAQRVLIYAF